MRSLRSTLLAVLCLAMLAPVLAAQGVTSAAITGVVAGRDSKGIQEATVTAINASNGERWQTLTHDGGRYVLDYLTIGGPYTIEVRAIGYSPFTVSGVILSLGERRRADFTLEPVTIQLPDIAVIGVEDSRVNSGRTGPAQTISDTVIARLPVRSRDFAQLTYLSPQAAPTPSGGVSIAGQSDRLNGFQIDGATNLDLTGYAGGGGFGTPGAPDGVRTLSVEALEELQVLSAPFDVRYGTFAGGLVNAVTRSGSNNWHGSFSGYYENQSLTGEDSSGTRTEDFSTGEFALVLGGPIVKNRAAFFIDFGLQRDKVPQGAPAIGPTEADSAAVGVSYASAVRFQEILRNTYHVDAGSFAAAPTERPSQNFFAKVTLQPALNNRIEFSYNYGHGKTEYQGPRSPDEVYALSSNGSSFPATINAPRLTWTMAAPRRQFANEMVLAYLSVREQCQPASTYSQVQVIADESSLTAGVADWCTATYSDQDILELTDNLSWSRGSHLLTFGTHDELIRTKRSDLLAPSGYWLFPNLDSLELGLPSFYYRTIQNPAYVGLPRTNMGVNQIGFYVQDQWTPTSRLTITGGFRIDVPFFTTSPVQNPELLSALGIDNSITPSGNATWSPRLGASYRLNGLGYLRGGVGIFSGRPAYHWMSSVWAANGLNAAQLICEGADVPAFTLDPANQPSTCGSGSSTPSTTVSYFNPAFRFPTNFRVALGTDLHLPWGLVGTVDLLYILGVDQYYVNDVNLQTPTAVAAGEGGRVLYGTIDPVGDATPNRISSAFGEVLEVTNASGDRSFSGTVQLQKRFSNGAELGLAYTYTDAKDRMSAGGDQPFINIGFNTLDGTLAGRTLATSNYSVPSKITFVGAFNLPLRFRFSLFYNGYSGSPYTFRVRGDANADGLTAFGDPAFNDPVYVPRDRADISLEDPTQWDSLNSYITGHSCLQNQRGQLQRRNSCRNGWVNLMNARLSTVIPTAKGQSIELMLDVFNVLNLLTGSWGVQRATEGTLILRMVGYDEVNQRGIYVFQTRDTQVWNVEASRWRLQLGARYVF